MRKKSTYPTPILGVCTLPKIRRPAGVAAEQVNFRSNPQHSLSRRARMAWEKVLLEGPVEVKHHYMKRNGKEYRVLLLSTGEIHVIIDEVSTSSTVPGTYMGNLADMQIEQINDTIVLLNTQKKVRMSTSIEGYINQPTHINVMTALQYEATLELTAKRVSKTGEVKGEQLVSYTVAAVDYPNANYTLADESRKTDTVAENIWKQLNGSSDGGVLLAVGRLNTVKDEIVSQENKMNNNDWGGPQWPAEAVRIQAAWDAVTATKNDILAKMDVAMGNFLPFAESALTEANRNLLDKENAATITQDGITGLVDEIDPVLYNIWILDTMNVSKTENLVLEAPWLGTAEDGVLQSLITDHVTAINNVAAASAAVTAAELVVSQSHPNTEAYTIQWNRIDDLINSYNTVIQEARQIAYIHHGDWFISMLNDWHTRANTITTEALAEWAIGEQPLTELTGGGLFRAYLKGNNVDVFAPGGDGEDIVVVTVTRGMGDKNIRVISPTAGNTDNMPLYAIPNSLVQIVPDPANPNNGNYYIKATPIKEVPGENMVEVIWTETRNPWIKNQLDEDTMPHLITLEPTVRFSWVDGANWRERTRGDEKSCPNPSFVDETITNIGYFQKRLMFISGNNVIMSETNDIWNFYKASALRLLVSDPVDIASSATGIDSIKWAVPHNKDMLVFARNAQFKIVGSQPVTPETVSMAMTTKFDMQDSVKPVSAGNMVLFPVDYGDSSGVFEYTAQPYTGQDMSGELTAMIKGYIKGDIRLMTASANLKMIFCVAESTNVIYVCEQFQWQSGKWNSWSKWEFHTENDIIDMYLDESKLWIVSKTSTGIVLKSVKLGRLE